MCVRTYIRIYTYAIPFHYISLSLSVSLASSVLFMRAALLHNGQFSQRGERQQTGGGSFQRVCVCVCIRVYIMISARAVKALLPFFTRSPPTFFPPLSLSLPLFLGASSFRLLGRKSSICVLWTQSALALMDL